MDNYLNGMRTLSNQRLSYLVIALSENVPQELPTPVSTPRGSRSSASFDTIPKDEDVLVHEYDILICATHFLGDGMALHNSANDFFGLLGSERSLAELSDILELEWATRWRSKTCEVTILCQKYFRMSCLIIFGR